MIAIYNESGYTVYSADKLLNPDKEPNIMKTQETLKFGVLHFAFLYDTKIFAIVPNKKRGNYASSKVMLWDEID